MENEALVLDLLEWVAKAPRTYTQVMDAWRTSCPRLPIWEDAVDHGLVAEARDGARETVIRVTPAGEAFLRERGRG
jgi:hypothetical protein